MKMATSSWKASGLPDSFSLAQAASPTIAKKSISRQLPKLHLSKLLLRRKSSKSNTIKSNISSPTAITTPQTPTYAPEVMQHSPSLYPVSPVHTEHSSSPMSSSHPDLRRVSVRHEDLRLAASESSESSESSEPLSSQPPPSFTPLLPSPVSWEREDESALPVVSPPSSRRARAAQEYKSYDDFHILSFYNSDSRDTSLSELDQHLNDESEHYSEDSLFDEDISYVSSSETEETPPTPTERVRRLSACSEDPNWPTSTKGHGERIKRFNARCCQVVQVPVYAKENQNRETKAMLATIVVGQGKARLVEISRPSSKQLNRSSNQSSTWSKLETEEDPRASSIELVEASAFSAYDKPSSSTVAAQAHALHRSPSPPDSVRLSTTSTYSCTTAKAPPPNPVSPRANLPTPPTSLPPSPSETLSRQLHLRRLERTLDAITQALDDSTLLVLTSPTVCALRSLLISDLTYIETLSKIFPEAQETALSALVAWVILDLYLTRAIESGSSSQRLTQSSARMSTHILSRDESHHPHDEPAATIAPRDSGESLHTIPAKARSLLGIDNANTPAADQVYERELVQRAVVISECVDTVARTLMEVCRRGSWDEDVWKSLRCLVELMEDADGSGEGAAAWA